MKANSVRKISIIGCGWLGKPLAIHLRNAGYEVMATNTSGRSDSELDSSGVKICSLKATSENLSFSDDAVFSCDVLIINFPPGRIEEKASQHPLQIKLIAEQIRKNKIQRVLFVSSTSVYPDLNTLVDENCEAPPVKASGKALLDAERILRDESGSKVTLIRFAGLIGYDRLPARFLAGKKELKDGQSPVNLIHRDDCIRIIEKIISRDAFGEIYNGVCDQHPLRADFYTRAAMNAGLPLPEFLDLPSDNWKIVSGEKLKNHLQYNYIHPDPMLLI